MQIFLPKEVYPGETRVAIAPGGIAKLAKLGALLEVEKGIGAAIAETGRVDSSTSETAD